MAEDHDFKLFPELTNTQIETLYFKSPHKQILEDFNATCVKVTDGDTITVSWDQRDFNFPVRFLNTNSPELNEPGGSAAQEWLEGLILNEKVDIVINPNKRIGKFGRILGEVFHRGLSLNEMAISAGFATSFENRREGQIPSIEEALTV
jgi:endonuclease YncB( thermonuclease family)|tara:strand:- start:1248 stop:1694 length:447 start_codon:yes stop_codon:yes gene_type:complete